MTVANGLCIHTQPAGSDQRLRMIVVLGIVTVRRQAVAGAVVAIWKEWLN